MKGKYRIKQFVKKHINNQEIKSDDDIFRMNLVNSLFSLQLIVFLENEFNIRIENSDLEIENFSTINAMADYVSKKLES